MTIMAAAMADFLPPSKREQAHEKVHDSEICPITYETVAREAVHLLKSNYFTGLSLNYNSPAFLDEKLDIMLTIKPKDYALTAYYFCPQVYLIGNVTNKSRLCAIAGAPMTNRLFMHSACDLRNSRLEMALLFDYMARNYRAQVELLGIDDIRATYIQRVTPRLYLGGQLSWTRVPQKLEVGYAARYETDKMVASTQVESSGDVLMTYVHKFSKKVSLATDFVYNCFSRDVKASVGFECVSTQSLVQGKIDSDGVVSAFLERKLNVGLKCLLSASLDLKNIDPKLGLSLTYG